MTEAGPPARCDITPPAISHPGPPPRRGGLLAWIALLIPPLATPARAEDTPLRVDARVAKETYYVGQGIDLGVVVIAEGERPEVKPPRVDGAEIEAVETAFRRVGVSGIGDVSTESNAFITRYRVVAARPGPLTIPPFVARLGGRKGASPTIRLTIHAPPPEGRPASFLRGVGPVEARAEAVPGSVRLGQRFEYRLVLDGPGATGSTQWPILPEFHGIAGLEIEPAGTDFVAEPPRRTYRYRARATAPGTLALPAVAVATFHPKMRRYVETRAPGVSVRVVDVPRFDPSVLPVVPDEPTASDAARWAWAVPTALIAGSWLTMAVVRRRTSARRWARRVARSLAKTAPGDVAARLASGLKGYLARASGHRGGELTPDEAAREVGRAVGDPGLAARARGLVERSDRSRFGHVAEGDHAPGLAEEASAFFEDLARRRPRKSP